jgi:hypothetical protein
MGQAAAPSQEGTKDPEEAGRCKGCKKNFRNIIKHLTAQKRKDGKCMKSEEQKKYLISSKEAAKLDTRMKHNQQRRERYAEKKLKAPKKPPTPLVSSPPTPSVSSPLSPHARVLPCATYSYTLPRPVR